MELVLMFQWDSGFGRIVGFVGRFLWLDVVMCFVLGHCGL